LSEVVDECSSQQGVSIVFYFSPTESVPSSVAEEILLSSSKVSDPLTSDVLEFVGIDVLGFLAFP